MIGYLISKKKTSKPKKKQKKKTKQNTKLKKRNTKYIIEIKISVLIMI